MTETRTYLRGLEVFAGTLPVFDPEAAPERPETLFAEWLTAAVDAGVREPHAMTVSTIGTDGLPAARMLLLKNVDARGWQFAVHSESPKGRDVAANPVAALTFYWPRLARQIRVRGPVEAASAEENAADYLARSVGSRAEASTGMQSRPLEDRQVLELTVKQALERINADPGLVLPEWILYTVRAEQVEFWQGDKQRKHMRLRYERDGENWTRGQLWP